MKRYARMRTPSETPDSHKSDPAVRAWLFHQLRGLLLIGAISVVLAVAVNLVREDGIPWTEDWNARAWNRTLPEGLSTATLEEARDLFESSAALFVDARDLDSYREGHIPGAVNLPVYEFEDHYPLVEADLLVADRIVTYCGDVTCDMSDELGTKLLMRGFTNVFVFLGGIKEWKEQGLPLETE